MYQFMHQILCFPMKLQFYNPNTVRLLKCARVFTVPFFFSFPSKNTVFYSPPRVSMDSSWTPHSPHGVLMESSWSSHGVLIESPWTPHGLPMESSWTLCGLW